MIGWILILLKKIPLPFMHMASNCESPPTGFKKEQCQGKTSELKT